MADIAMTLSISEVKKLLKDAEIAPKKSLGQNFVIDPNTVRKIARLADVDEGSRVLEIGAGLGSLTLALAETGAQVTAIETDRALIPLLKNTVGENVTIIKADARELSWTNIVPTPNWTLVANLPYNIATSLVLTVLDEVPNINRLLVMVQQEAGQRIAASVGDPAYGAVSVRVALRAKASIVGHVPPSVFFPRPRVNSVLVELERASNIVDLKVENELIQLLRMAFTHRRKMLRKSLKGHVEPGTLEKANIAPTSRPEELDLHQWLELAQLSSITKP